MSCSSLGMYSRKTLSWLDPTGSSIRNYGSEICEQMKIELTIWSSKPQCLHRLFPYFCNYLQLQWMELTHNPPPFITYLCGPVLNIYKQICYLQRTLIGCNLEVLMCIICKNHNEMISNFIISLPKFHDIKLNRFTTFMLLKI